MWQVRGVESNGPEGITIKASRPLSEGLAEDIAVRVSPAMLAEILVIAGKHQEFRQALRAMTGPELWG